MLDKLIGYVDYQVLWWYDRRIHKHETKARKWKSSREGWVRGMKYR